MIKGYKVEYSNPGVFFSNLNAVFFTKYEGLNCYQTARSYVIALCNSRGLQTHEFNITPIK